MRDAMVAVVRLEGRRVGLLPICTYFDFFLLMICFFDLS